MEGWKKISCQNVLILKAHGYFYNFSKFGINCICHFPLRTWKGCQNFLILKSARLFLQGLNLNLESIVRMYHFPLHTWDISLAKTFLNEKQSASDQPSLSVEICDAVLTHRVVQYCCQIYISQIKTSDNPVKRSQISPTTLTQLEIFH